MKALRLVSNRVVTAGDPPFEGFFTLEMAEALMRDDPDRAIDIMTNLTPKSASQLMTMIRLDKKLKARYEELVAHSNAKRPKPSKNAPFKIEDILDEVFVFCPPIASILFLTDGRRLIREDPDDLAQTITVAEYEKKYGETVDLALERIHAQKVAILERAMYLMKAQPRKMVVSLANSDAVFDKTIIAYERDQVGAFASRLNTTVLGIEEEAPTT